MVKRYLIEVTIYNKDNEKVATYYYGKGDKMCGAIGSPYFESGIWITAPLVGYKRLCDAKRSATLRIANDPSFIRQNNREAAKIIEWTA